MNVEKPKPPVWEEMSQGEQYDYLEHIENLFERGYLKQPFGVDEQEYKEKAAKAYYNSTIKKKLAELEQ